MVSVRTSIAASSDPRHTAAVHTRTRRRSIAALLGALGLLVSACGSGSSDAAVSVVRRQPLEASTTAGGGGDDGQSGDTDGSGDADGSGDPGGSGDSGSSAGSGNSGDPVDAAGAIAWDSCGDQLDCGTLTVPLDYDDPQGAQFELALVRHRAADPGERIGSLLVNPGGPGSEGLWLAEQAELIYGDRLLDRFDIVAWDPRGTGSLTPFVDCVDSYDSYVTYDVTPDSPEDDVERDEALTSFVEACTARTGNDVLSHISTEESAKDMDAIRRALGEDTISYFGFSYGSELGATWATLFPETVRAAVLDGAADPTASDLEATLQQAAGFEEALDRFLAECADDRSCPFHNDGDPAAAFDELIADLDTNALVVDPDRTPVNQAVALIAVANAMYSDLLWPELAQALADAQNGDGAGLLAGFDDYYQRRADGTYDNLLEAFNAITCLDADPDAPDVDDEEAIAAFQEVAPRLWPTFAADSVCSVWPVAPVGRVPITGAGAGPIVVVGTTGDAATPLESSRAMAEALEEGVFVVVEADQHTGYNVNECINDTIEDYLVDLDVPEDGLVCS